MGDTLGGYPGLPWHARGGGEGDSAGPVTPANPWAPDPPWAPKAPEGNLCSLCTPTLPLMPPPNPLQAPPPPPSLGALRPTVWGGGSWGPNPRSCPRPPQVGTQPQRDATACSTRQVQTCGPDGLTAQGSCATGRATVGEMLVESDVAARIYHCLWALPQAGSTTAAGCSRRVLVQA